MVQDKKKRKNAEVRKTVGAIARELLLKQPDSVAVTELGRQMLEEYQDNVVQCIARARKELDSDFYIIVLTKKERLMPNVLRNYFLFRQSCPTPNYDQTVFLFKRNDNELEHLWTLPSRDICFYLRHHAHFVHPSEYKLLDFVLKFDSKELYKLCKKLNKEKANSIETET